jgi:UDP-N-acetyl-D-mannosaminuronic acid dehydrogenase
MQNQKNNIKNVCVIGCGRVGLPLALMLEYKGLNVYGIDIDKKLRDLVYSKTMPFYEPGFDDLLSKSKIVLYSDYSGLDLQMVDTFIITVGTPLGENIESEYKQILQVINNLIDHNLIKNKLIILRSTISPGTSQFLIKYIEKQTKFFLGSDFYLAYCPERIAEGKSFEELQTQPNIIGYYGKITKDLCNELFNYLSKDNVFVTYEEAELIKLFSNIYRYINFSIPNYFMYIAKKFGVDYIELNKNLKYNYSRNNNLSTPGFTSGTCLRKDWGFINENFPQSDIVLQAYKINEFMPKFYVDLIAHEIGGKNIGILGYTMKNDVDDTRDSLIPKMIKYIEKEVPDQILINEPNLPIVLNNSLDLFNDKFNDYNFINDSIDYVIRASDIIFIAMNHKEYKELKNVETLFKGKIVIDCWGILNKKLINHF